MSKLRFLFLFTVIPVLAFFLAGNALAKESGEIIHDAEYYVLEAQYENPSPDDEGSLSRQGTGS